MTELTKPQIETLEKPFLNVTPRVYTHLWRVYQNLWALENGVPVRASKQTISTLTVEHDKSGHVTNEQFIDERTMNYSVETARKYGRYGESVLSFISNWGCVHRLDEPISLVIQETKSRLYTGEDGELDEVDQSNLIGFLDSRGAQEYEANGPVAEGGLLPRIATIDQLIAVMGTYPEPDSSQSK
jgi:hypothetical protein